MASCIYALVHNWILFVILFNNFSSNGNTFQLVQLFRCSRLFFEYLGSRLLNFSENVRKHKNYYYVVYYLLTFDILCILWLYCALRKTLQFRVDIHDIYIVNNKYKVRCLNSVQNFKIKVVFCFEWLSSDILSLFKFHWDYLHLTETADV